MCHNVSLLEVRLTVVIPTLTAGEKLVHCLRSLEAQTRKDFDVVIVDNSGEYLVRPMGLAAIILENRRNAGFGAAINQGARQTDALYVASLNDDAVARPRWVEALIATMDQHPEAGMCASRVLLDDNRMDSAGMLIAGDGSSKQRGHDLSPSEFDDPVEVLFASGSAAIYRRQMLDDVGGFDEDFFLYCEDTDLGLRARWAGWKCLYAPGAIVEHHYSQSAGKASPLKAYLVERNRQFVAWKNFPAGALLSAPFTTLARFAWHVVSVFRGSGAAAEFRREGNNPLQLIWIVLRAHLAVAASLVTLLRKRRAVLRQARIPASEFRCLMRNHSIGAREVAAQ